MSSESDCGHRRGGLISFLRIPGIPNPFKYVPNPLGWVPRPRILGGKGWRRGGSRAAAPALVVSTGSVLTANAASTSASPFSGATPAGGAGVSKVPLKPASDVLAGALARAASQSTIHPLDTLKVRLQPNRMAGSSSGGAKALQGLSKIGQLVPPPAGNAAAVFSMDFRAMGQNVASLYKGVFGAASGAGIAIGAYFAFYGVACNTISARMPDMSPGSVAFAAGGVAALGSSFVKVPLAVCIRSVQAGIYPNFAAAARSIVAAAGPRGLFTGYLPTVLEDVPDMAIKVGTWA